MADWEEAAFSGQRRLPHGRLHRGGKASRGAVFDPRRTFGQYDVACEGGDERAVDGALAGVLDVHGLTDGGTGVVCSLSFPGRMRGMALLAGSRKALAAVVQEVESGNGPGDDDEDGTDEDDDDEDEDEEDEDGNPTSPTRLRRTSIEEDDERENRIARVFEKNSFRSPKFWMRWRCEVLVGGDGGSQKNKNKGERHGEANSGYITFSGNDCKSLKGTISSDVLKWKDLPIRGWKRTPKPSACAWTWTEIELDK